ncbi:MAG TPA: hypothetical protein VIO64_16820 [Pseudobacteroides sp.]|uniref:hypothetical protein n=1 Tax=Pseudobacteroides sp. TaxID=1968840 RepID=UPI002F9512D7
MKTGKIGLGVFLLAIGIIWILISFNVISFSYVTTFFISAFKLWPLILIFIGVNLVFKYNSAVKTISWILYFSIVLSYGIIANPKIGFEGVKINLDLGNRRNENYVKYSEKIKEATKNGKIDISLGATKINLDGNTKELFSADVPESVKLNKVDYSNNDKDVKIDLNKSHYFDFASKTCSFNLNKNVLWDIDMNTGAINGTMDMTDIKLKKLDLNIGASSIDMKFGSGYDKTKVDINAGASNINLTVPRSSGIRIKISKITNHTNLDSLGWNKNKDVYESPNYDKAESKIDMEVQMGISNFNVYLSE